MTLPDLKDAYKVKHDKKIFDYSNAEQITILMAAKQHVKNHTEYTKTDYDLYVIGVCEGISLHVGGASCYSSLVIPLLTKENARIACRAKKVKMPNNDYCSLGYWWEQKNTISRLAFINWMIEQLKK